MTRFLEEIEAEVQRIRVEDFVEPWEKRNSNFHVVGTMSQYLMRLFTIRHHCMNSVRELSTQAKHVVVDLEGRPEPPEELPTELQDLMSQFLTARQKTDALNEIFWTEVRYEFPQLAGKGSIGVCEGWQVYWSEESQAPARLAAALLQALGIQ